MLYQTQAEPGINKDRHADNDNQPVDHHRRLHKRQQQQAGKDYRRYKPGQPGRVVGRDLEHRYDLKADTHDQDQDPAEQCPADMEHCQVPCGCKRIEVSKGTVKPQANSNHQGGDCQSYGMDTVATRDVRDQLAANCNSESDQGHGQQRDGNPQQEILTKNKACRQAQYTGNHQQMHSVGKGTAPRDPFTTEYRQQLKQCPQHGHRYEAQCKKMCQPYECRIPVTRP